tara:strand:+ start:389 stop:637 length:249 start_codon:yes stop_codon:yes gene_type:complete
MATKLEAKLTVIVIDGSNNYHATILDFGSNDPHKSILVWQRQPYAYKGWTLAQVKQDVEAVCRVHGIEKYVIEQNIEVPVGP